MTIVNQGSSAVIDVAIGQKIAVSTPGEAYVDIIAGTLGAGYSSKRLADNVREQVFGPYGNVTRLQIRAVVGAATFGDAVEPTTGTGGASEFKELQDAPNSYAGQGSMVARVKGDETGLEFLPPVRKAVKFADRFFSTPSSSTVDVSAYPYNGEAIVGDDVLILNPDTPADSGIWTISAINGNDATLTRRNDSLEGAFFTVGETINECKTNTPYVCTYIWPVVGEDWLDSVPAGHLDGATAIAFDLFFQPAAVANALAESAGAFSASFEQFAISGGFAAKVRSLFSTDETIHPEDGFLLVDSSGGNLTLFCAPAADFRVVKAGIPAAFAPTIKRIDASGHTLTIQPQGSDTINGASSVTLAAGQSVRLISDGVSQFWTI
jgi:hypothetical protein